MRRELRLGRGTKAKQGEDGRQSKERYSELNTSKPGHLTARWLGSTSSGRGEGLEDTIRDNLSLELLLDTDQFRWLTHPGG